MRYVRTIEILTILIICSYSINSGAGNVNSCSEVESIDFKNSKMKIEGRGTVQLVNGMGYSSDAPDDEMSRDWRITLTQDNTLHPLPSITVRLIKINADHITGSGAWDHVLIFQCNNGKPQRIFYNSFLYGVKIRILSDSKMQFTYGEWMKEDPMCCPSKERTSTYQWVNSKCTYILNESTLYDRK